jgi:hypothetical protein
MRTLVFAAVEARARAHLGAAPTGRIRGFGSRPIGAGLHLVDAPPLQRAGDARPPYDRRAASTRNDD